MSPIRTYNKFYSWIATDDFLSLGANIIDGKNTDWLETWYGITLGRKVESVFTKTEPVRGYFNRWSAEFFFGGQNVYDETWAILATIPDAGFIVCNMARHEQDYYIFAVENLDSDTSNKKTQVYKAEIGDWGTLTEVFLSESIWNDYTPVVLTPNTQEMYFWSSWEIYKVTAWAITEFPFTNGSCVWITQHWTQIKVYTETW